MKKIFSLITVFALMLAFSSMVLADLVDGGLGKIESGVIFEGIPMNPDSDDTTGDDTTSDDTTGDDTTSDDTTGDDTTGDDTTGDDTTGDDTTGDDTTGDDTTGDDTTGDDTTGDDTTGDDTTGDDNTGDDTTGDDNTGDDTTGDDNTGDGTTGDSDNTDNKDDTNNSDKDNKPKPPTVVITPKPEVTVEKPDFGDIKETDWFYNDVVYVYNNKIMMGTSNKEFSPSSTVTRAMAITVIYRIANEPAANGKLFDDVADNTWYSKAVAWGADNKIVNGVGNNKFAPVSDITREQMAVMLYNYAKTVNKSGNLAEISVYDDATKVSSWAEEAMRWAVGNKIINGKTSKTLAPTDKITRAETATILKRFVELTK